MSLLGDQPHSLPGNGSLLTTRTDIGVSSYSGCRGHRRRQRYQPCASPFKSELGEREHVQTGGHLHRACGHSGRGVRSAQRRHPHLWSYVGDIPSTQASTPQVTLLLAEEARDIEEEQKNLLTATIPCISMDIPTWTQNAEKSDQKKQAVCVSEEETEVDGARATWMCWSGSF